MTSYYRDETAEGAGRKWTMEPHFLFGLTHMLSAFWRFTEDLGKGDQGRFRREGGDSFRLQTRREQSEFFFICNNWLYNYCDIWELPRHIRGQKVDEEADWKQVKQGQQVVRRKGGTCGLFRASRINKVLCVSPGSLLDQSDYWHIALWNRQGTSNSLSASQLPSRACSDNLTNQSGAAGEDVHAIPLAAVGGFSRVGGGGGLACSFRRPRCISNTSRVGKTVFKTTKLHSLHSSTETLHADG